MLILEGPDCAGKSTLLKKLLDAGLIHTTRHWSSHDLHGMLEFVTDSPPGITWCTDRLHYSHIPYDTYYRKCSPHTASVRMIDRALLSLNSVVILCLPPWEQVLSHWVDRKDEELIKDVDVLHYIYNWYSNAEYSLPVVHYDYTKDSFTDLARRLTLAMPHEITRNSRLEQGAGSTEQGSILLVGEQVNSGLQYGVPFADLAHSGTWITNQLEEAGLREEELFWVNVKKLDGAPNTDAVYKAIHQQHPRLICALGGVASSVLEKLNVQFEAFAHPQYWRRFKHHYDYPLITFLEEHRDGQ